MRAVERAETVYSWDAVTLQYETLMYETSGTPRAPGETSLSRTTEELSEASAMGPAEHDSPGTTAPDRSVDHE